MEVFGWVSALVFWAWGIWMAGTWVQDIWVRFKYRPLPNPDRLAETLVRHYDQVTLVFCYEQSIRTPAAVYAVARETVPVIRTRRAIAEWWVNACRAAHKSELEAERGGVYRSRQWMH